MYSDDDAFVDDMLGVPGDLSVPAPGDASVEELALYAQAPVEQAVLELNASRREMVRLQSFEIISASCPE